MRDESNHYWSTFRSTFGFLQIPGTFGGEIVNSQVVRGDDVDGVRLQTRARAGLDAERMAI